MRLQPSDQLDLFATAPVPELQSADLHHATSGIAHWTAKIAQEVSMSSTQRLAGWHYARDQLAWHQRLLAGGYALAGAMPKQWWDA